MTKETEKLFRGLEILAKYVEDLETSTRVGTDVIYAGPDDSHVVSEEDAQELIELGWQRINVGGWARFF